MGRLIIPLLSLAFLFGACARGPEARTQWLVKKITKTLDLDAAQKAQLEAARLELLKQQPIWEAERRQAMSNLAAAVRSDKPIEPSAMVAMSERCMARPEARLFMASNMAALHRTLRPDQREKMAKAVEKMGRWHFF